MFLPSSCQPPPINFQFSSLKGNIQFQNVKFTYPSRPEYQVLKGIDLEVIPGQTVALVGASGCGKSTAISLTQRFYDVDSGVVSIDGRNIKEYSLQWLRSSNLFHLAPERKKRKEKKRKKNSIPS